MSSELPQKHPENNKSDINLIACDVDGSLIKESTPNLYPEIVKAIKHPGNNKRYLYNLLW